MRITILIITIIGYSTLFSQSKYGKTPKEEKQCKEALIYVEYMDNDPELALSLWRTAYQICPAARKSQYQNGVKIYEQLLKSSQDKILKKKYLDTICSILDQRIVYFQQEGYVRGAKGIQLFKYNIENPENAYKELNQSLELSKSKTKPGVLFYLMKSMILLEKEGVKKTDDVFLLFDKINTVVNSNENDANYKKALVKIEQLVEPYMSCETLISITEKSFKTNKNNIDWLKRNILLFKVKKCYDAPIFEELLTTSFQLSSTVKDAELLAKIALTKKEYGKNIDWLNKAINMAETDELKASIYFNIAQTYMYQEQYVQVKKYALKAIALKKGWGAPQK